MWSANRGANTPYCQSVQESALFVRGLPMGTPMNDLHQIFNPFGPIRAINIQPYGAFVHYVDWKSCNEALKHEHIYRNRKLAVFKRNVRPHNFAPVPNLQNIPLQPQSIISHKLLLQSLESTSSVDEQIHRLKQHVLAGEQYCQQVQQQLCSDIANCLKTKFIIKDLYAFGSMITGLAFKGSDIDVYTNIELKDSSRSADQRQKIALAAKCFHGRGASYFTKIAPIRNAKTPILKAVHIHTNVSCDLSVRDPLGYWNSRLLRLYLNMNVRFFDMMVIIKYWAQVNKFINTSKFSSYAISILAVSFLISLQGSDGLKLVPSVKDLQANCNRSAPHTTVDGWFCGFEETPVRVALPETPQYSVLGLVKMFFSYVASLPFDTHVVSILPGKLLSRHLFMDKLDELPDEFLPYKTHIKDHPEDTLIKTNHVMVVQDPFRLNHNLTERINLELRNEFLSACEVLAVSVCDLCYLLRPVSTSSQRKPKKTPRSFSSCIELTRSNEDKPNVFEEEFNVLTRIFSNILLLDVKEIEDNPPQKKIKLSESDNVHSTHKSSQTNRTIVCSGNKEIWSGRNKARQKLAIDTNPSFKDEERISNEIISQPFAKPVSLNFNCHFQSADSPSKLCLEFEDLVDKNKKSSFKSLMCFLHHQLEKWFPNFMKEFQTAADNLP